METSSSELSSFFIHVSTVDVKQVKTSKWSEVASRIRHRGERYVCESAGKGQAEGKIALKKSMDANLSGKYKIDLLFSRRGWGEDRVSPRLPP